MKELFVRASVEIEAEPSCVWKVLTDPVLTKQWVATGWKQHGLDGGIDSEWRLGGPVLWKDSTGKVCVTGNVTALEPNRLLRFTVFDVNEAKPPTTDEDGITYRLAVVGGQTTLSVTQGDFGKVDGGERFYGMTAEIWDRVLPKIKELAEN